MAKQKLPKWTDERVETLVSLVGPEDEEVSVDVVKEAAEVLETTTRSVASKLRKMGYEVESSAKAQKKAFTEEEEEMLRDFVTEHEAIHRGRRGYLCRNGK